MDQAKAMAADLDGKLNEAVGMDSDGKPLKPKETAPKVTVPATPAGTTTAAKTAPPAVTAAQCVLFPLHADCDVIPLYRRKSGSISLMKGS